MTFREKLRMDHPLFLDNDRDDGSWAGGCKGCPDDYGYANMEDRPCYCNPGYSCTVCWNREMPWPKTNPNLINKKPNDSVAAMTEALHRYICSDIATTAAMARNYTLRIPEGANVQMPVSMPKIKNVIFNAPATIVIWQDGTKTVVKTQNDEAYDPEKGLAMAISKKVLGNGGSYYDEFHKWLDPYNKELAEAQSRLNARVEEFGNRLREEIMKGLKDKGILT